MLRNVNIILQKANIKYGDLFHINKNFMKSKLKKKELPNLTGEPIW